MSVVETAGAEDEDDILAAEFVLGVLPFADHAVLERRTETDARFAARVADWHDRLLPLSGDFGMADPAPSVKQALDARLFGLPARRSAAIWGSLALWRGLAGIATAVLLLALALPWLRPDPARLVAALADPTSGVHYMAVYDRDGGAVGLSHVSGTPAAGRDFELWVIEAGRPPVSLGVIPAGAPSARLTLDQPLRAAIRPGARLAISLEPAGGSPTGLPTGDVVAAGDLRDL
ncbi:hypothetical protein EYF88_00485 [Paracoccus sediminis]|uniref:Anti-sigma-K factor RskA n=1 Tax=Paracoccus sediminis TaxID=1214787 RepID=A0A238UXI4_9RHOB|nr:anti-sigma factor [Paracoccus sediminis]TBN52720.1 hypothetical protein EYF88_00485 [Paracoccus sediminis]SNR26417.1 Anti-sigma-K factor RskA [Paracoccus sediminis]